MTAPFETIKTQPDNIFWDGQGISFESEIKGVRCTTGFINPGEYELTPKSDMYIIMHDGELATWTKGYTPEEGYGALMRTNLVPDFVLHAGTSYLLNVREKNELFWNEFITPSEVFTYTCFYPDSDEQIVIVEAIVKAQTHKVARYLCELQGTTPPTEDEIDEWNELSYEAKYGFDA